MDQNQKPFQLNQLKPQPNDRKISKQHGWAQHVARVWLPCYDVLGHTIEPPVNDHSKCQVYVVTREVVAYESLDDTGSKLCLVSIWQLQRLTPCFKCFIHVKSQFRGKIRYYQLRNFHLLCYPGMQCCNTLSSNFRSIICHGRFKTKENFKLLALKVQWSRSLTRGARLQEVPNIVI